MDIQDLYFLGKITKLHGYKGELTAWLDTDSPLDYTDLDHLFLYHKGKVTPFIIESIGAKTNTTLKLKLEGINSEEEALPWVKAEIFIEPEEVSDLDQERDEIKEWIGFHVHTEGFHPLGVLTDVQESGLNPMFEIEREGRMIYVPMQPQFIQEIDVEKRELHLILPPGLLELYLNEE
jgi:16S rRNA processing protein RimM